MSAPTAKELVALEEFREKIAKAEIVLNPRQSTDMALMSWLRARELNIPKALEMLQKNLAWRKELDIDNILSWVPPESYAQDYPYEICGQCTAGSPVLIIPFGKWDIRRAVESGDKVGVLRQFDQMFAKLYAEMYRVNDELGVEQLPVSQIVLIADLGEFGYRQLASKAGIQTIMDCVSRLEGNYPEIVKMIYVINAPRIFSILLAMVKPFMTARTFAKVEIYNNNENKWKPALRTHISGDQLPVSLGGTKSPNFDLNENDMSEKGEKDQKLILTTTTVGAGKDLKLDFVVQTSGQVLRWSFESDSHDIGFSAVLHGDVNKDKDQIVPHKKYASNKGSLICQKLGTYTVIFDNKYSQFRSKTVRYAISLEESVTQE